MANTTISPNMNMPVPVVGTDPGPDWATNLNSCLAIIDEHDHTSGMGVPITPDGLNINGDLPINNNNLTTARSVRFTSQSAALAESSDLGCLYELGDDLYYIDGAGNNVRITQGGSVTGASGTITGLPSGTASASYSAGVFTFESATSTPARMSVGSIVIAQELASGKTITIGVSGSQVVDYALTMPLALPSSSSVVTSDASGNLSFVPTAGNVRGSEGGGTVTLTNSDRKIQTFNLTSNETVKLPTSGVVAGDIWTIINPNPYILTIQSSGSNTIIKSWGSRVLLQANIDTPTTAGNWTVIEHTVLYGRAWASYTPTYNTGASVNAGASSIIWSRSSIDTLALHGDLTFSGGSGTNSFTLTIPVLGAGITIATGNYPTGNSSTIGTTSFFQSPNNYWGTVGIPSSSTIVLLSSYNISDSSGSREQVFQTGFPNSGDKITFEAFVRITEWAES